MVSFCYVRTNNYTEYEKSFPFFVQQRRQKKKGDNLVPFNNYHIDNYIKQSAKILFYRRTLYNESFSQGKGRKVNTINMQIYHISTLIRSWIINNYALRMLRSSAKPNSCEWNNCFIKNIQKYCCLNLAMLP